MAIIYICGVEAPQNGKNGFVDTAKIKARLKAMKCEVINPGEIETPSRMSWGDSLNNRVELLKKSNAIYVLPNWKESTMARIELTVAMDLKLQTFFHPANSKELKQFITTLGS